MALRKPRPQDRIAPVVHLQAKRAKDGFSTSDALVAGLISGDRTAMEVFVERYGSYVERILVRVMGADPELSDLVQDVFLNALSSIQTLRSPALLKPWLRGVTVFVARGCLRRRRRRRWLTFRRDEELPDLVSHISPSDSTEALRRLYRVLDRLPPEERIVFSLRFIAEMELTEVADACRVSRSTIKRRQSKAEALFRDEASKDPLLSEWMERGARWRAP